jgi:predicted dehydrogenase
MQKKIRVGVVGTSGWADFMYLSTLQSHPQAELAALCGRNRERAEALAAKYAIPQVYTDYQDMIARGGLDALVVGSPDDLHHEIVLQGLAAGLHVLCDKPLALTARQAREMHEAAAQAGVCHMVLFTFRWMPYFRYIHDLVEQGVIGRVYNSEFHFIMGYARAQEYFWRLDRTRANGAVADLGVHMVDMARWLVGDIERVSANLGVFVPRPGADGSPLDAANDSAFLLTGFENGALGAINVSLVTHMGDRYMQQKVTLYGEAGSLEMSMSYQGAEAGPVIRLARSPEGTYQTLEIPASYWGEVPPTEPWGVFSKHSAGCRAFIDSILEDRPAAPDFFDGYKAQQVIEAALLSHESGRWIQICDVD